MWGSRKPELFELWGQAQEEGQVEMGTGQPRLHLCMLPDKAKLRHRLCVLWGAASPGHEEVDGSEHVVAVTLLQLQQRHLQQQNREDPLGLSNPAGAEPPPLPV